MLAGVAVSGVRPSSPPSDIDLPSTVLSLSLLA